jgi:hypothetical protein
LTKSLNPDEHVSLKLILSDMPREKLEEMIALYARLYRAADGFWYLAVNEKVNNKVALECDIQVWEIMARYEAKRFIKHFNILGKDVFTLANVLQYSPWFLNFDYKMEAINESDVLLTISRCPTLEALEKEGTGREDQICNTVEPRIFKAYADYINPAIKVSCLQSPPRADRNGICCQWSFTMP